MSTSVQERNQRLMAAFQHTPEDIEANRNGYMTDAQKQKLALSIDRSKSMGKRLVYMTLFFIVLTVIVAGPTLLSRLNETASGSPYFWRTPIVLIIPVGAICIIWPLMVLMGFRRTEALKSGNQKLHQMEGKVKLYTRRLGYTSTSMVMRAGGVSTNLSYVQIGRQTFYSNVVTSDTFEDKQNYRIFYLKSPGIHLMVAAEAIS